MGDRHDYVALDWVKGEIEEVLKQAQYELEAYVESPDDTARMKFCLTYLHQVRGTLQMVEFYGAAMLAEEMELVAQALLENTVNDHNEAREVLMQAILQLPNYLDHIKLGHRDIPVVLLPILNDLRGSRGESLLSETSLFQPKLDPRPALTDTQVRQFSDKQFVDLVRKLRQMYQVALLGLLKGKDVEHNTEYLLKVTERLAKVLKQTPVEPLWLVAAAALEGVAKKGIALNSGIKELLKQLEPQLKLIATQGPGGMTHFPEDLIKNLLFYVAKSEISTPLIDTVRGEFDLKDALPTSEEVDTERSALSGPDQATMGSVAVALIEEIAGLKDKLDVLVQGKIASSEQLGELLPSFKQLSDTMGMLALGTPRKVIQEQLEMLLSFVNQGKQASNTELMDIAGALLYVEASLIGLSDRLGGTELEAPEVIQLNDAQQVVLKESSSLIDQIKDKVVEYVAQPTQLSLLSEAADLLMNLRGTLIMVPQIEAADIARACSNILHKQVDTDEKPADILLHALAEALSGVEYFLERIQDSRQADNQSILLKAREAILPFIPSADLSPEDGILDSEAIEIDDLEDVDIHAGHEANNDFDADNFDSDLSLEEDKAADEPEASPDLEEISLEVAEEPVAEEADSFDIDLELPDETPSLVEPDLDVTEAMPSDEGEQSEAAADEPGEFEISLDLEDEDPETAEAKSLQAEFQSSLTSLAEEDESVDLDDVLDGAFGGAEESVQAETSATSELQEDDDDDLIDDEIIEIFLEEAEEVLETIHEFWPQFKANSEDSEALTTTRRAFHTLKGSGRMVSAEDIGETAWAIENMFNRLLDNTIGLSESFISIVDHVIEQVPALIDAFKHRKPCPIDVGAIQEYANKVAQGEDVDPWSAPAQSPNLTLVGEAEAPSAEPVSELDSEDAKNDQLDPALLDVFSSELETHLAVVQEFIDHAQAEDYSTPINDELQRAFHTLKGSAHMAHIEPIADVAAALENFSKDLRAYHIETTAEVVHLFIRGKDLIDEGFSQLAVNPFAPIAGSEDLAADIQRLTQQLVSHFHQDVGSPGSKKVDPQVLSVFLSEGMDILMDAESILARWEREPDNRELLETVIDEIQTLEKGAQMAELLPVVGLCEALQDAYGRVIADEISPQDLLVKDIEEGHEALLNMMDMVAASQAILPETQLIASLKGEESHSVVEPVADAEEIELDLPPLDSQEENESIAANESEQVAVEEISLDIPDIADVEFEELPLESDIDPELLEIFLEEAEELIDSISESLDKWQNDRDNLLEVAELQRDLHTFKGGARMAEINAIGDLAHELEDLYEGLSLGKLSGTDQLFDLLHVCHDRLNDMVQALKQGKSVRGAPELITAIQMFITGESLELPESAPVTTDEHPEETPATIEPVVPVDQPESITIEQMALDADAEVVEIFMDEAEELMEELDLCIQNWQAEPDNSAHNEAIQRVLHTVKGGARIAGLSEIGDIAHDMETELQNRLVKKQAADEGLFQDLHQQFDLMANRIDGVQLWLKQGAQGPIVIDVPKADITPVADDKEAHTTLPSAQPESAPDNTNVVPLHPQNEANANQPVAPKPEPTDAGKRQAPQEMIKVPAELLDGLVNLAGETSISRGRLENQVTDFGYTLEEMDATLDRLRDQLRRLDMETEAQVLFRREQQGPDYEDFDPLEMDRYSQLQQLSRSLVESASDLMDIKSTLLDKTRDAETLLLQQSRVNTELQEGLMKTRMVPFSRMVPRLRRIVRQVSQELGKKAELHVTNAEGEMDRSLLERLISPLEHMLRNAVDHGLETNDDRRQSGKPEVGSIHLSLSRDGGDVVLRLIDDGKGINVDAVRKKAIERGLLEANAKLPEQDILQFILQAGFSTAEKVTQISGRGVGMDVVNSEIKQVGGTVAINSVAGQGTEFIIRLPFTVSVNRALMAKVGEALFAIPLNSIEGIVRVSSNNLRELLQQEKPVYHYAGREYQLEYLGNLLRDDNLAKLPDNNVPMPVVLIRGSNPAAIQVDTLMGSREIVVKTLGPQFNSVIGVSGGTILGDGSVVIILDLPNMMRHVNSLEYKQHLEIEHQVEAQLEALPQEDRVTSVLVVDDSVTVRKVTTRLLERNGFEVRTAKDGVDAMATLQEYKPSVVLLDIEMPRMDGFEVATQMRHSPSLKDIPIIMITSRTGDKHRERAMSIGVTEYMGKPFQEDKLLGAINELTGHQG